MFLKFLMMLFISQNLLASGPGEVSIPSTGFGYGIENTEEEAMAVAKSYAKDKAEKYTEEDQDYLAENGYLAVKAGDFTTNANDDFNPKYCDGIQSSEASCKAQDNGKIRCDYTATFNCEISAWHESQ